MESTYQVFNPLTGIHTQCPSEQAAKEMVVDIAEQIIKNFVPTVNIEIPHDNGDVTWQPVDFASQIKVAI